MAGRGEAHAVVKGYIDALFGTSAERLMFKKMCLCVFGNNFHKLISAERRTHWPSKGAAIIGCRMPAPVLFNLARD